MNTRDDVYFFYAWSNVTKEQILKEIEKNPTITKLIIFGPEEHEFHAFYTTFEEYLSFREEMKAKNISVEFLISAPLNKFNKDWKFIQEDFLTWPSYFAHLVLDEMFTNNIESYSHNKIVDKHFISLNRRGHWYRCLFIDELYKNKLFDYSYVTWHNLDTQSQAYQFRFWEPDDLMLDYEFNIFHPPEFYYKNSAISLVSESDISVLKLTEKTYLPIYHKRPFLIFGAKQIHQFIKSQGFVLFEEFVNYEFDRIDDPYERVEAYMYEVTKLTQYEPMYILKKLESKIKHNYRQLFRLVSMPVHSRVTEIINLQSQIDPLGYYAKLNILNHTKFKQFRQGYS